MNERTFSPVGGTPATSTDPHSPPDDLQASSAEQRLTWLTAFTTALTQTSDEAFFACITQWLVPAVADLYCIAMVQPDGALETQATAHIDTHQHRLLSELKARYQHDPHTIEVIRSGQPQFFLNIDLQQRLTAAHDARHAELLRTLNVHAAAIMPLQVQGRTIGALNIGFMAPERRLHLHDAGFLSEIAQRVALALDQQHLRRLAQEAIEARDATLAIVAHELRTPIAALITQIQLLRRRIDEATFNDERVPYGMQTLEHQARRLNLLVDTLLEATYVDRQPRPLANERFELGAIVRRVYDAFTGAVTHHTLHADLAPEPLFIAGDPLRIEQALQNLLQNAVKYSPYGGTIIVRLARRDDYAQITISDEGIGIPPEARTRIFERFYRAANAVNQGINGIGVGLYIVHAIIALHNGTIRVAETPTTGASFIVELPLAAV